MENSFRGASGSQLNQKEPPEDGQTATKWVDIREAARLLNVSEKTVRRRIKTGKVHSQKISGVWFVALDDHPKLSDLPSPSPPPPAPPPRIKEPANDEKLDEIKESIRYILKRLDEVDKKLYVLAEEREHVIAAGSVNIRKMERVIEDLTEENRKLREELPAEDERWEMENAEAAEDVETFDRKQPPSDTEEDYVLPKSGTGDTLELKAMIASNERGLSLLREELRKKDKALRQRERDTATLENELRMLKGKSA